ncbi:MAG: glycosyltransferase, partial [Sphingobacteriales bacterium]
MNRPVVSVVMPCYNQAMFLTQAVESLQAQTFPDWECIIVNDESPDNTEHVALALCKQDPRIKYISQKNGGPSSARNHAISLAQGEYILPLDADDIIGDNYLLKAVEAFNNRPDLRLVYCEAAYFGLREGKWDLEEYSFRNLLRYNTIFCSAIFRKEDWERVGGYDESLRNGWEDWAFWIKLLDPAAKVYRIPEVLFFYRIKSQSHSTA